MTMFGDFLRQKFPGLAWYGGTILVFIVLLFLSVMMVLDIAGVIDW